MASREQPSTDRPRYRRISTRMWGDEKFRRLSKPKPNGQSLWQFLLTGPQTTAVPGLFAHGEAGLAEMLEWPLAGFRKAWRELEQLGMVKADWRARLVWIPNAVAHNPPESPNVVRSWRATVNDIPECALKVEALAALGQRCKAFGEGFSVAFAEAFPESRRDPSPKALANQDQEQDQEQEVQRARFKAFWEAYPRKEGEKAAWEAWLLISPGEPFAARIVESVRQHLATKSWREAVESRDFSYVPLPANYLTNGRWDDQLPAVAPSGARRCRHPKKCSTDADCTQRMLDDQRAAAAAIVGGATATPEAVTA
jgi:hypothetical protein